MRDEVLILAATQNSVAILRRECGFPCWVQAGAVTVTEGVGQEGELLGLSSMETGSVTRAAVGNPPPAGRVLI